MAKSIRILLAIAAWYDYEIWQMNVKMAFLNSFVEEEIFMDQPEGFTSVREEQKVYRLQRSIYSLKQASRSWNTRFDQVIRGYDFIKNEYDPCVYKKISGSLVAYLVLYVDDILFIENNVNMLGDIKAWLSTQFFMKDMGEASYILGIKIYRDRSRRMLGLTQSSYIKKVLKRFKMENSKLGFLPMRHGIKLSKK
ncbi:UNVERIFIED_CONTAM: putative transposon Ty5-1 protein [Sesamum latifolium]|uniref:Transposon Ty5-1 protein n=1 Tax=Sesamum latifolium TaxID=2727402 RepID=A0AAW2WD69_9LAMI